MGIGIDTVALERYIHYDWVEELMVAAQDGWEGWEKGLVLGMWWEEGVEARGMGRVRWKVWKVRKDEGFWEEDEE